uniref:Putative plasma membrane glycoprotein cd36 n=1 Tax=Corethrella appendiculata TaxID=1370023 RepID=U5EUV2_9DIPT
MMFHVHKTCKISLFLVSIFTIAFAIIFQFCISPLITKRLTKELTLANNETAIFKAWVNTSNPLRFEVYLFNWTNVDEFQVYPNFTKPHFEEIGPFVFEEFDQKINMKWSDDREWITFGEKKVWHFKPELSDAKLDDKITTINPVYMGIGKLISYPLFAMIANGFINDTKLVDSIFWKDVRAGDLLFDGYKNTLQSQLVKIIKSPFEKFGWCIGRNNSETFFGNYTINTGASDIENVGSLSLWKGQSSTDFFRQNCDKVSGRLETLWPPNPKKTISLFVTEICRPVKLEHTSTVNIENIETFVYTPDENIFDNGEKYSENECFCPSKNDRKCSKVKSGVTDVSKCKHNIPLFASLPHFYNASASYRDSISGMKPNPDKHKIYLMIEPVTGVLLEANAALQFNVVLRDYQLTLTRGLPEILIPTVWVSKSGRASHEQIRDLKKIIFLLNSVNYLFYGLCILGLILLIISMIISLKY